MKVNLLAILFWNLSGFLYSPCQQERLTECLSTAAGRRFAEQDFCLALVRLLQRFELRPAEGHSQPPRQLYETLLMPDPPVRVRFVKRC